MSCLPAGDFLKNTSGGADAARVLVAGDDRAKWGVTVKVLDEIRKAHVTKLSMETAPGRRASTRKPSFLTGAFSLMRKDLIIGLSVSALIHWGIIFLTQALRHRP